MKRIIGVLLAATLIFTMTGCGGKEEAPAQVEVKDAVEILTTVWDNFDEANKFPIGGGGYENMTTDVPGVIDPADTDSLTVLLSYPAEHTDMIDDAASMIHAMNANTFTAASYHLADGVAQQDLADVLKDSIMNRQWMCGFPEVLLIAGVSDDYVVTVIGKTDLVENFKTTLADSYGAAILCEESLM